MGRDPLFSPKIILLICKVAHEAAEDSQLGSSVPNTHPRPLSPRRSCFASVGQVLGGGGRGGKVSQPRTTGKGAREPRD